MDLKEQLERLRAKYDSLDPKKQEKISRGTILVVTMAIVVGLYYATDQDKKKPEAPKEKLVGIQLGERLDDDVRATVEKTREEIGNRANASDKKLESQQQEIEKQKAQLAAMQSTLQALAGSPGLDLPDLPGQGSAPNDATTWAPPGGGKGAGGRPQSNVPNVSSAPPAPEVSTWVGGIGSVKVGGSSGDKGSKKKRKFYLSPGFMEAKLLTGLKAKTVDSSKGNPEAIMLRIQAPAILPNEVRAQLEGCLVVANGYGDLSSERVETRLVSIDCLDYAGKSLIHSELHGMVVDSDAVKGLAAHPVAKWGTNMARLAFAGAIQGAGAIVSQSSQTRSVSPLGQTTSIDPGEAGKAGLGSGVSKAAEEYSRIISDLVRQQAPVLELGPGKDVTVVVTEPTWLEISDYEEGQ